MTLNLTQKLVFAVNCIRAGESGRLRAMRDILLELYGQDETVDHKRILRAQQMLLDDIITAHETLERIEAALARVNEEAFGLCVDCGAEIREHRLLVQPWSERCVGCQERREWTILYEYPGNAWLT